jgi:hypothetical protein
MKTIVKIGTWIGLIMIGTTVMGVVISGAFKFISSVFSVVAGLCVLLACWSIFKGLTKRSQEADKTQTAS